MADGGAASGGGRGDLDLASFVMDLEDEDCPFSNLHAAAYKGDAAGVGTILEGSSSGRGAIDARIRPFMATPLRLAATG